MTRTLLATGLAAALAFGVPLSAHRAEAASGSTIKIATLAPRGSAIERGFMRINKLLREATGGAWKIKFFPSGVAGDEKDVIRKMKVGQMDAALITTTGLSQIVREVAVLDAPGVIESYPELDRVKAEMKDEWQQTFAAKGTRLLGWGEAGEYRYFSKKPITHIADLKKMRPWLWTSSPVQKEVFRAVGATGVPLGVPEVYGALQTGMVDAVMNTAVGAMGLQWWSKVKHVTTETTGILMMGFVLTDKRWNAMPENVRKILQTEVSKAADRNTGPSRANDRLTYKKLIKAGLSPVEWDATAKAEYSRMAAAVRSGLTGRVYDKALLDRVLSVAKGKK